MPRPEDALTRQREGLVKVKCVALAMRMQMEGQPTGVIIAYLLKKGCPNEARAARYVRTAHKMACRKLDMEEFKGWHFAKSREWIKKAEEMGDLRTALAIAMDERKMFGAYPEKGDGEAKGQIVNLIVEARIISSRDQLEQMEKIVETPPLRLENISTVDGEDYAI